MSSSYIPYGAYWSTPFAKWQGSLAHLNALHLAALCGRSALEARRLPLEAIDLGILGVTNPQLGGFFGLPWVTGLMGIDRVAGPTIQQACATSVRAMQMASHEIAAGSRAASNTVAVAPRYADKYTKEVIPALTKQFGYTNPNEVPKIQKVVVNMGLGAAVTNPKIIESTANLTVSTAPCASTGSDWMMSV